jgi:hypothetical protein
VAGVIWRGLSVGWGIRYWSADDLVEVVQQPLLGVAAEGQRVVWPGVGSGPSSSLAARTQMVAPGGLQARAAASAA